MRDRIAELSFLAIIVFLLAGVYAVNHEENGTMVHQKQKGVAEDGR